MHGMAWRGEAARQSGHTAAVATLQGSTGRDGIVRRSRLPTHGTPKDASVRSPTHRTSTEYKC